MATTMNARAARDLALRIRVLLKDDDWGLTQTVSTLIPHAGHPGIGLPEEYGHAIEFLALLVRTDAPTTRLLLRCLAEHMLIAIARYEDGGSAQD